MSINLGVCGNDLVKSPEFKRLQLLFALFPPRYSEHKDDLLVFIKENLLHPNFQARVVTYPYFFLSFKIILAAR